MRGRRRNVTPLVLYEAISIGTADALDRGVNVSGEALRGLLDNEELKSLTTGATNSKRKLVDRIDYVREALEQWT